MVWPVGQAEADTEKAGRSSRLRSAVFTTGNVLAGISVGAYFIPKAMAYATLASFERAAASADLTFEDYRRRLNASEDLALANGFFKAPE